MQSAVSLYIHVPYCRALCHYCDFAKTANFTDDHARSYFRHLADHLRLWLAHYQIERLHSVFIGGGTPSLFTHEWGDVFAQVAPLVTPESEVTLEANPDDITAESMKVWRDLGINRLSIGLQTWQPAGLKVMQRLHSAELAQSAISAARKVFPRVGIDLIYGWPGQTDDAWQDDLAKTIALDPDHVSAYVLTFESRTPLGRAYLRGAIDAEGDDELYSRYMTLRQALGAAGYEHGEVSNFAKPGALSVHNQHYWQHGHYLGVGTGAHGFLPHGPWGARFAYDRHDRAFSREHHVQQMQDVERFGTWETERSREDWVTELVLTGLRTAAGVDLAKARETAGVVWQPDTKLEAALQDGQLILAEDRLRLASAEWFRENTWALDVTACLRET